MTSKRKLQVFISSTYRDLKIERQAAVEAILKAGHIPAGMELFAAGSESQMEIIRRWIDESDIYMLILGGRYGSIEQKTALSYTELEYDYAVAQNKPVFSVVITEAALDHKVKTDGRESLETESPKELRQFREKVLSRICSFFSDPKDIKLAVHETLADFQARHRLVGWVSGKASPDISGLIEEITKLRAERDEAAARVAAMKADRERQELRSTSKWRDDEFEQICAALGSIEIRTKIFNDDKLKPEVSLNVLRIFDVMRDRLITGVTNQAGAQDIARLLYFDVCPKLEVHELAGLEKVNGVVWQRYRLTPKGKALLLYLDRRKPASAAHAPSPAHVEPEAGEADKSVKSAAPRSARRKRAKQVS